MEKVLSKPKVIKSYYENGNLLLEEYYLNAVYYRVNGPSYISYYENGNIKFESYYINGKRHRDEGPSRISYYENGSVQWVEYHLNGIKLTREEWYSKLTAKQRVGLLCGKGNE
jgi:antitoxin component YwqK of YwqJK toxin-antitoxin module